MSFERKLRRDITRDYRALLETLEWHKFSAEKIREANFKCWSCGDSGVDSLQVHHLIYRDILPWEYPDNEVRVLCRKCHHLVHTIADDIWVALLRFQPHELEMILKKFRATDEPPQKDVIQTLRELNIELPE